ncbi:DUF4145 domain-containing protein [Plantactinospora siamensis]|uniref:DUF4145 domain-containing protein n=1 Tax=Plantactinospora siamensis TaxID=555372 RepID=A0ABV6P3Q8_9ACTN
MDEQLTLLVESSDNFRFLAEPAFVLAADAVAAELYVDSDPDAAMAKSRRFAETLAKMLARRAGLDGRRIRDQNGRIEELARAGVIPEHIRSTFHVIRRAGNQAVHEGSRDRQKAASMVAACFVLGAWWYREQTGREVAHSFTPRPPAEAAPLRESITNIENRLTELQAAFQAEAGRAPTRSPVPKLVGGAVAITLIASLAYLVGPRLPSARNPPTGGSPSPERPPGPPLAAVSSFHAVSCRSSGWVVPSRGTAAIPYSPDRPAAEAVLASDGEVTVTVQGLQDRSVVLQSMKAQVERRGPAVAGTYLPMGCQGGVTPRKFLLDLDAANPRVVAEKGSISFPYKVAETEPEQFVITPTVRDQDIEFRLVIRWTSGADEGELVLPERAQPPFRVTAATAAQQFCLDLDKSLWRPSC